MDSELIAAWKALQKQERVVAKARAAFAQAELELTMERILLRKAQARFDELNELDLAPRQAP